MKTSSAPEIRDDESTKYKGVRKRKWGKWVSEIRLPNSRERIWLGSYDSPEKAARAFDAALFCLRGRHAKFNFPGSPPDIPGAAGLSPAEIQAAASRFAAAAADDSELQIANPNSSHSPSPSPSEGGDAISLDVLLDDTVGSTYNTSINYLNCNYGYDNGSLFPGQCSGSGYYPTDEYGIFQGFDDLSTDFYVPTTVDNSHAEESYDTSLNHGSFLWNF